jgi:hypothetical protein
MPNKQPITNKFVIVGESCSLSFFQKIENLGDPEFWLVKLTQELVHFRFASTWNVNFRPQIDFTNSSNDAESVHLVVQANPTSLKMHGLCVVRGIG